jgi:hypothetical protein
MIFSIIHIRQIVGGEKTQTRRLSDKYQVGHTYCIQEHYGGPGLKFSKIRITDKRLERPPFLISEADAKSEGGYTPKEYEELWIRMYGGTRQTSPRAKYPRWAYTFKHIKGTL